MSDQQIIREFEDGFTVRVSIKRGTGTRDQDELSATVHGETLAKALSRSEEAVKHLDKLAEQTREIQHGESDE